MLRARSRACAHRGALAVLSRPVAVEPVGRRVGARLDAHRRPPEARLPAGAPAARQIASRRGEDGRERHALRGDPARRTPGGRGPLRPRPDRTGGRPGYHRRPAPGEGLRAVARFRRRALRPGPRVPRPRREGDGAGRTRSLRERQARLAGHPRSVSRGHPRPQDRCSRAACEGHRARGIRSTAASGRGARGRARGRSDDRPGPRQPDPALRHARPAGEGRGTLPSGDRPQSGPCRDPLQLRRAARRTEEDERVGRGVSPGDRAQPGARGGPLQLRVPAHDVVEARRGRGAVPRGPRQQARPPGGPLQPRPRVRLAAPVSRGDRRAAADADTRGRRDAEVHVRARRRLRARGQPGRGAEIHDARPREGGRLSPSSTSWPRSTRTCAPSPRCRPPRDDETLSPSPRGGPGSRSRRGTARCATRPSPRSRTSPRRPESASST